MTVEQIKEEFKDACWEALKNEPHIDEDDKEFFNEEIEKMVSENGGWEKVKQDVETGIKNGYTKEQQFQLLSRVLNV